MYVSRNSSSAIGSPYSSYLSNYLNYKGNKPIIATPTMPQVIPAKTEVISEQNYTSSLESFVKLMDNSALDSVTKFIKNLRQPTTVNPNSLSLSTELFSQLKSGESEKEQVDINFESLKELITLSGDGFDITFLENLEPSLKSALEEDNTLSLKIQEQLDKNFHMLYLLQLSQYERSVEVPTEKEQKVALQLSQNLSELTSRIPPSALVSQEGLKNSLINYLEET